MEATRRYRTNPHWAIVALSCAVLLALVVHFLLVWLYLTPTNPLKLSFWRPIHAYIHPLFGQDWRLFAPTPISHDELMMIKVRWREAKTERTRESQWIDITSPVHRALHRRRIGPYSKLARPFTGILSTVVYRDQITDEMRVKIEDKLLARLDSIPTTPPPLNPAAHSIIATLDSVASPTAAEVRQRLIGREMAYRLASAIALRMLGGRGDPLEINVRFAIHEFPRFSERDHPEASGRTTFTPALGWEKLRRDVVPL